MTDRETAAMLAKQAYESAGTARDIGESLAVQTLATVALVHAVLALEARFATTPASSADR